MKKKIIIRYNWINENDTDIKKSHLDLRGANLQDADLRGADL